MDIYRIILVIDRWILYNSIHIESQLAIIFIVFCFQTNEKYLSIMQMSVKKIDKKTARILLR